MISKVYVDTYNINQLIIINFELNNATGKGKFSQKFYRIPQGINSLAYNKRKKKIKNKIKTLCKSGAATTRLLEIL